MTGVDSSGSNSGLLAPWAGATQVEKARIKLRNRAKARGTVAGQETVFSFRLNGDGERCHGSAVTDVQFPMLK